MDERVCSFLNIFFKYASPSDCFVFVVVSLIRTAANFVVGLFSNFQFGWKGKCYWVWLWEVKQKF